MMTSSSLSCLLFSTLIMIGKGDDCIGYTSCDDCALDFGCGWDATTGICNTLPNGEANGLIVEEAGCPDYNPITIISLDSGESVSYSLEISSCSLDYDQGPDISLNDLENMEFNHDDHEGCQQLETAATFWVISSDDNTLNYHLFGKVIAPPETDDVAPCDIVIVNGAMTSITCPLSDVTNNNGEDETDKQSDTLYAMLRFLLPRADSKLFDTSNNIVEEDGKGTLFQSRNYVNDLSTSYKTFEKNFDLDCFNTWESDVVPIYLIHDDNVQINDGDSHISNGEFHERYIFNMYDISYTILDVDIKITLTSQVSNALTNDLYNSLYGMLYTGNSDDYYTKTLSSHDWHKGQYSDNDYNLHISYDNSGFSDDSNSRRRMLYREVLYEHNDQLFESPSIWGLVFSGDVEAQVGIDCSWDDKVPPVPATPSIATLASQDFIECLGGLDFITLLLIGLNCVPAYSLDLQDCDLTQATAETNFINCIGGYPAAAGCAAIGQAYVDLDNTDPTNLNRLIDFGIFGYSKFSRCDINCVDGGGITGYAKFILNVNNGEVWSYTITFDENAEFDNQINVPILPITIPVFGVLSAEITFGIFVGYGLQFDAFMATVDSYTERFTPYANAGLFASAVAKVNVIVASAAVGVVVEATLIDFSYPLSVTINFGAIFGYVDDVIDSITNGLPLVEPDVEEFYDLDHGAEWGPVSIDWYGTYELCVVIIFCDSGTFRRRRMIGNKSDYYNINFENEDEDEDEFKEGVRQLIDYPGMEETVDERDIASVFLLYRGQSVIKANGQICFDIIADKDLEDYIIFDKLSDVTDDEMGLSPHWVADSMIMNGRFSLIHLISATISIVDVDFSGISDSSEACTNGMQEIWYVPQIMCLDLKVTLRNNVDYILFQQSLDTSSSKKQYFLTKLSELLLNNLLSPFAEHILSIDVESGNGVTSMVFDTAGDQTEIPTTQPTQSPTIYRMDLIQPCINSPCDCNELNDNTCMICHSPEGCDQCENGYFKPSYSHQCQNCYNTFGNGCLHCQDFNGCAQCADNWLRLYDDINNLWYCEEDGSTHVNDDWRWDTIPTCQCPYECNNEPCSCGELEHCNKCAYNGCDECEYGYFKKNYNTPCLNCKEMFGDSCMFCQDFQGCAQCSQGYTRLYDQTCELFYCA